MERDIPPDREVDPPRDTDLAVTVFAPEVGRFPLC